jgi:hypothetical protein
MRLPHHIGPSRSNTSAAIRTSLVIVGVAAAVAGVSACVLPSKTDNDYHGSVGTSPAASSIIATPAVPAVPVTISGNGEAVETAELVATGYTVKYQASSWTIIVAPVQSTGDDGPSLINAIGQDTSTGASGTTTYRATGRTTFHVSNTQGPWTLTFTPLS